MTNDREKLAKRVATLTTAWGNWEEISTDPHYRYEFFIIADFILAREKELDERIRSSICVKGWEEAIRKVERIKTAERIREEVGYYDDLKGKWELLKTAEDRAFHAGKKWGLQRAVEIISENQPKEVKR